MLQTLQDELTGAAFHPLDDNLLITHGKGHLTFWTRRKDGFFERTDIIKPVSRTGKGKGKGKGHPITRHEGPEGE